MTKIYDVIGTVYGREEPDSWVLIGNHRDAITFGAIDAGSGTSGMMELSRGIGELLKKGERRVNKEIVWISVLSIRIAVCHMHVHLGKIA